MIKLYLRLTFFCFLFLCTYPVFSQEDSLASYTNKVNVPTYVRLIKATGFLHDSLVTEGIDTLLNNIHRVNNADVNYYTFLANNQSAADASLFSLSSNLYSNSTLPAYRLFFKTAEDFRYYFTNKRYTEAKYFAGTQKEQNVSISHTQNIFKNWNLGFDFGILNSLGFMNNGKTHQNKFDIYTWYRTPGNRYQVLAFVLWEKINNEVNGGIKYDSLYEDKPISNLSIQGLEVNLDGAENHIRNRQYSLKQVFDLGTKEKFDTGTSVFRYKPLNRFILDNRIEKYSFGYIDGVADSNYYANTYYNDLNRDSLFALNSINEFSFHHFASDTTTSFLQQLYFSGGVSYQWMDYKQRSIHEVFDNVGLKGEMRNRENASNYMAGVRAEFIVAGENTGNYKANGFFSIPAFKSIRLNIEAEAGEYNPEVWNARYYSNHFIWENKIDPVSYSQGKLSLSAKSFHAEAGVYFIALKNYTYLDITSEPTQYNANLNVLKIFVRKNFVWGKFRFNNDVWFQQPSNSDVLHLPSFSTYQALYFTTAAFKKALYFETGLDLKLQSQFKANEFMPATGMYYLQNEKETSGYALMNLFFNFRIKTADLFFKLENVMDELISSTYFLVPHYPMQGRTIKFGFRWRFYD